MKKHIHIVLLVIVFALAFFLRFYQLGHVPYGFYQDESAIGYNAYSILKTGRDEYGKFLPLYFKSFGDYKLPVYIYSTVPSIMLFGMTEFAVRFPSAFFGFLSVVMTYFFVRELTKNKHLALLTTFLLAINPWSLHYNRATFEVSICLFFFVTGSWLILKAAYSKWKGAFFAGTVCFILSLYAYNLTRLLSPLLYALILAYLLWQKQKLPKKEGILTGGIALLSLLPFVVTFFGHGGVSSASGTLFYSSAVVQAPLVELREYYATLPGIFTKLFFNMPLLNAWQYINNVASYFSVSFFFVSGSTHGNHGIGNVGEFYLFELPLFILGLTVLIKAKKQWVYLFIFWAVLTILVASLTRDIPQATRSFFLVIPIEVFSAVGLMEVGKWVLRQKNEFVKYGAMLLIAFLMLFNIVYYFTSYYVRFPILYASKWRLEDKALSLYLQQHQGEYSKIIFDNNAGFIYTSLLFYTKYPPLEFQKTVKRAPDDNEGFSQVLSFGKYEFKDVDFSKDYQPGTLIVTTTDRKPADIPPLASFPYPVRPVAFAVKQDIVSYPVQDFAYVVVAKK